jgi:hypothetical protein
LVAAVAAAFAGCGGTASNDFERAKSGAVKTPSEVLQEARSKSGEGQPKAETAKAAPK